MKSLTLYVNKILARIVDSNQLSMLANDKDYEKGTQNQETASGFETLKRHFRRQSLTSTVTQVEAVDPKTVKPSETDEGIWRKALKRMSTSAWRSPATINKTLDDINTNDIKLLPEAARSKCSLTQPPIEEEKEEVIETFPMEVK